MYLENSQSGVCVCEGSLTLYEAILNFVNQSGLVRWLVGQVKKVISAEEGEEKVGLLWTWLLLTSEKEDGLCYFENHEVGEDQHFILLK